MASGLVVKGGMNPKQQRFVEIYVAQPAGKRSSERAAIEAGYSARTARVQGPRLLANPRVRAAILEHDASKRIATRHIDAAWVLQEIVQLWETPLSSLFDENGQLLPIHEMGEDAQRLIAGVEVRQVMTRDGRKSDERVEVSKVKLIDRVKVLEMIGRHLGVNAFGNREEAEANQSFAELLQALGRAVVKGTVIDAEFARGLLEGGE